MSEQIRAAFHRNLQSRGIPSDLFQRDDSGAYEFATVEHDWSVWQAAIAVSVASPAAPASPSVAQTEPSQGLSPAQEPKYTVNGSAIVNRASGEAIPADEPVFILRARDRNAISLIASYSAMVVHGEYSHWDAVQNRIADFVRFRDKHPERMKAPDTATLPSTPQAEGEGKQS